MLDVLLFATAWPDRPIFSGEQTRITMLSAAAAQICLVQQMPASEQVPALTEFLVKLNDDFPGHTQWLKSERTFEGAVRLSQLLSSSCDETAIPKKQFHRVMAPYLMNPD